MPRKYRIVTYSKDSRQYIQLIMEYRDHQGIWHTKLIRSYGQFSSENQKLAQQDLAEIQQLAIRDNDPIPIGTVDQAIWAGFYRTLANPIGELPVIPLNALRDFAHLGAWIIDSMSGNIVLKVSHTQPQMPVEDQARFVAWLQQKPTAEHARVLAYLWSW